MRIIFTKISDTMHRVTVVRNDGTSESAELNTREFLNHDLAHFVIELELPIRKGYWGCVSSGASLSGEGVAGTDAQLAETLAGPLQTLIRTAAEPDAFSKLLPDTALERSEVDLAARVHERVRRLRGHWKAVPYGGDMELEWPEHEGTA